MSWADSVENANRPTRAFYIAPHLRNSKPLSPSATEFFPSQSPNYSSPAFPSDRFGSRDFNRPSRAQRRGRNRESRATEPSPFEIAENFNNLGISEEESSNVGINFDAYEDIPIETSGNSIPLAVNTFAEIDLGEALNQNIKRCNYVNPTPVQKNAMPILLAGRDLMACAQTGSGKTAAFCFPIISGIMRNCLTNQRGCQGSRMVCPLALILSPTRELSRQIHEEAKKFAYQTGVKVVVVYGGAPIHHQLRDLERGVDILVATPGRLVDMIERARVSLQSVKYLAVDEADRMLDMGFEPQIRKIVEQTDMPCPGKRQTMLFSATFPHEIQRLAADFLSDYIFMAVGRVGSSTDLITQRVEYVPDLDKRNHLMDLLHAQRVNGKQALTLVFVETKRGADSLENWLSMNGFRATAIHGDRTQPERERALKSFKTASTPVMVATDVAARGLDIPDVAHVINFDLPKDIDDYVHRIGRTGRAGKSGLATAFFNDGNQPLAKALAELMQEANQELPDWLIQYAEKVSYGGGRNRRTGGNRFGGHDYRKEYPSRRGNYQSLTYEGGSGDGGHDFHNDFSSRRGNYQSQSCGGSTGDGGHVYPNDYSSMRGNYQSQSYEGSSGGGGDGGGAAPYYSHGYNLGHEEIVPSGWD